MGWSSGSSLFADIAEVIANTVADDDERRTVYEAMIESFMDRNCDTLDECLGTIPDPVLDAALTEALDIGDNYADDDDDWPDGGREDFT